MRPQLSLYLQTPLMHLPDVVGCTRVTCQARCLHGGRPRRSQRAYQGRELRGEPLERQALREVDQAAGVKGGLLHARLRQRLQAGAHLNALQTIHNMLWHGLRCSRMQMQALSDKL